MGNIGLVNFVELLSQFFECVINSLRDCLIELAASKAKVLRRQ